MNDLGSPGQDRLFRWLILGSCLLIFISSLVYGLLHGFGASEGSWRGYHTLMVDAKLGQAELDRRLRQAGFGEAITAGSSQLSLAGPQGLVRVPYARIAASSGVPDPRRDAWVDALPSFFQDKSGAWLVAYLPASDSLLQAMVRLGGAFDHDRVAWKLLEWQPVQGLVLLGGVLLIAGTLVWFSRGRRLLMVLAVLPWVPLALDGGPMLLALAVACLISWSLLMESLGPAVLRYAHDVPKAPFFWDQARDLRWALHCWRLLKPYLDLPAVATRFSVWALTGLAWTSVAWFRGQLSLVPGILVVGALSWPALALLLGRLYQIRHRRSEHQLFAPVPMITRRRPLVTALRQGLWPLAGLVLAVTLAASFLGGGAVAAELPVPVPAAWGRVSYAAAWAELEKPDRPAGLPGTADLIHHLAYQSALPWTRGLAWEDFRMPEPGAALRLSEFAWEGKALKPSERVVIRFDDGWLSQVGRQLPADSVERMLLSQGRMCGLVYAMAGKVYSADIWAVPALAGLVALVLPFWLAGRNPGFRQLYGSSRISAWNRKAAA